MQLFHMRGESIKTEVGESRGGDKKKSESCIFLLLQEKGVHAILAERTAKRRNKRG